MSIISIPRIARIALVTSTAALALAGSAAAQGTTEDFAKRGAASGDAQMNTADRSGAQDSGIAGDDATSVGEKRGDTTPAPIPNQNVPEAGGGSPAKRTQPEARRPVTKTTCTTRRRVKRCVTRRNGVLVRVCVTKRGRKTCRPRRARSAMVQGTGRGRNTPVASASALNWQGFPGQVMRQVGKIVSQGHDGRFWNCSGTVVSRSLVLTAAHCVADKREIAFVPGATWNESNELHGSFGYWKVTRTWSAPQYASDDSVDYALMEIAPLNGQYVGDVVGAWTIHANLKFNTASRVYATGYPASGHWRTAEAHLGNGQYACDSTYEGHTVDRSSYVMWTRCPMNGGASGGPWFVQLADGSWTIGGVNDWCWTADTVNRPNCEAYGDFLGSTYFDSRFISFYQSVAAQV